jgi:integrase/recombinase XerC
MHNGYHKHLQVFTDYLRFEKRYSEHTVRAYHDDLTQLFDFTAKQFDVNLPQDISSAFVRSWLAALKEEKLTAKSINRKISSARSFFKYLMRTGVVAASPLANISAPKISKRLPGYIEEKDVRTLMEVVEFPDSWKGRTDQLLLVLFYQTGMRLSELINLKESQINMHGKTIKVLGKGNKERVVPVSSELTDWIQQYIDAKKVAFGGNVGGSKSVGSKSGGSKSVGSDAAEEKSILLVSEKGKKLYPKSVYLTVKKYLGLITTSDRKSPHILRHSFATHLSNNGADINAVKELLGHASLASTQIYTHNSIQKLKDIHKKAHPKA